MLGPDEKNSVDPGLLALKAKQGDREAFADLFVLLVPLISHKAARFVPRARPEYEDLVQEGAIGLIDAVGHYDPASKTAFTSYASVCIEHRMVSALRAQMRKKNLPLSESVPLDEVNVAVQVEGPEDVFIGRERLTSVMQAVQTHLSPLEKRVLGDTLEGRSYREVAAHLGLTEKSVDNALQRVRRKLGRAVSRE